MTTSTREQRKAGFSSIYAPWSGLRPRFLAVDLKIFSMKRGDLRGAAPHPCKTSFCPPVQQVGRTSQLCCSVQPRCTPSGSHPYGAPKQALAPEIPVSPTGRRHGGGHARRADSQTPFEGPESETSRWQNLLSGSKGSRSGFGIVKERRP